jgi:hypothetical protein
MDQFNGSLMYVVLKSWIQALFDVLEVNMTIDTVHRSPCYSPHELFRGSVVIHLETNRLRPRVRAIQKARPLAHRAKVLGRAFLFARTDANNAEVAFPSTTCESPYASYYYRCCCKNIDTYGFLCSKSYNRRSPAGSKRHTKLSTHILSPKLEKWRNRFERNRSLVMRHGHNLRIPKFLSSQYALQSTRH